MINLTPAPTGHRHHNALPDRRSMCYRKNRWPQPSPRARSDRPRQRGRKLRLCAARRVGDPARGVDSDPYPKVVNWTVFLTHPFAGCDNGPGRMERLHVEHQPFFAPGVGQAFDLGVYLIATITGLFGPAQRVQAMGEILIPDDRYIPR